MVDKSRLIFEVPVPKSESTMLSLAWNPTTGRLLPGLDSWLPALVKVFTRLPEADDR
jgi:hypothetical protein